MSRKDFMEFAFAMGRHSKATLYDCQRLCRYAATYQRLAVEACNRELTRKEIEKRERVKRHIVVITRNFDADVLLHGDPRGATVKIQVPDGYTNDWGKEGICVPTS